MISLGISNSLGLGRTDSIEYHNICTVLCYNFLLVLELKVKKKRLEDSRNQVDFLPDLKRLSSVEVAFREVTRERHGITPAIYSSHLILANLLQ